MKPTPAQERLAHDTAAAGRMCPADYRYPPMVFDRPPALATDVLYVVGALYGNLAALDTIVRMAAAEATAPTLVFNGDFHWFDAEPNWFAAIEEAVRQHAALRGNVETEIARERDIGAGCGCAYPESVDDGVVQRSNSILNELRDAVAAMPAVAARLAALPMHLVAAVGPLRIGIVHGDATSLAGWRFAHDALDHHNAEARLNQLRELAQIDLFACTHTCLPALRDFGLSSGRLTVINNGAAGMPNFSGTRFGLLSRIATSRSPHRSLYGLVRDGVHIDAIPIEYDHDDFLTLFLARWPEHSAAHLSYFRRLLSGPDFSVAQAAGEARRST